MRTATIVIGVLIVALIGGGIGAYMTTRGISRPPDAVAPEPDAAKADAERAARAKAEAEMARAEQAARVKAEAERAAREQAAAEKARAEEAARQQAAAEKLRAEEAARAKAAAEHVAREQAAEKARAEEAARAKAEAERVAREKATAERRAAQKAEAERQARLAAQRAAAAQAPTPPPRSAADSYTHYRDLAIRGDAGAAFTLGEMYEAGRGVERSNNWAYMWYSIAERRGVSKATPKKEAVASKLQAVEIDQADRQAQALAGTRN